MINIVTRPFGSVSGPAKVVRNLIKGLERIKYPYLINKTLDSAPYCYIPNDRFALPYLHTTKSICAVGPNLYVLPRDIPNFIRFGESTYLQPCEWAAKIWRDRLPELKIGIWPVGIDTEEFVPGAKSKLSRITIYHKMRDAKELKMIQNALSDQRLNYQVVQYGRYLEKDYKQILRETDLLVWHGRHESQGIALQEALACNVPVLVCDVKSLTEERGGYFWPASTWNYRVTSAPYFDARCGEIIDDLGLLGQTISKMLDSLSTYRPREFILENLTLEGQAWALLDIFADSRTTIGKSFLPRSEAADFKTIIAKSLFQLVSEKMIRARNRFSTMIERMF